MIENHMSEEILIQDQIRDELLSRAYKLAMDHHLSDDMILHYEGTIGLCRIHVAINMYDVRSDKYGHEL